MNPQQPEVKERVFGDDGNTVEEVTQHVPPAQQPPDPDENQDPDPDLVSEAAPAVTNEVAKYRIGDKTFATQAEALAYAESQVQPSAEIDAYRQVLREAVSAIPRAETVMPAPQPTLNAEELYTDPENFLKKFETKIKTETLDQIDRVQATREQDERVWREFCDRHPELADFREDITALAARNAAEVQAVIKTKGQSAAYDYVATKYRAQVERAAAALRPKRALPNSGGSAPAGTRVEKVTPKQAEKKPLSFAEQLRSIRKR
jgi:hypothetical protein